jgi:hypothetical protein
MHVGRAQAQAGRDAAGAHHQGAELDGGVVACRDRPCLHRTHVVDDAQPAAVLRDHPSAEEVAEAQAGGEGVHAPLTPEPGMCSMIPRRTASSTG